MRYTKTFLITALRQLDRECGAHVLSVINVRPDDPFDFDSLGPCCDCGLPGISYGQLRDCRYPTDGAEGLHAHVYPDRLAFHLDAVDACRDVVNHGVKDTRMVEGMFLGAGLAALVAALGGSNAIGKAAMAGAVAGGVLGARTPARMQKILELRDLITRMRAEPHAAA